MWPQWGLCIFVGAPVAFAVNFMPVSGLPPPQSITLMRLCDCDLYSLCVPAEFQFSACREARADPDESIAKSLCFPLKHSKPHVRYMLLHSLDLIWKQIHLTYTY